MPIDQDVLAILGNGRFLNRLYAPDPARIDPSRPGDDAAVGLFIGYFPTQRSGQSIHSPQNCLPGAGWSFESSAHRTITAADGTPFHVGEYVITNGTAKQAVVYWYQAHGRSIASDYLAKAYMMADAIRLNRTDGALVRVITPVGRNEPVEQATERAVRFASLVAPRLPQFIPN